LLHIFCLQEYFITNKPRVLILILQFLVSTIVYIKLTVTAVFNSIVFAFQLPSWRQICHMWTPSVIWK